MIFKNWIKITHLCVRVVNCLALLICHDIKSLMDGIIFLFLFVIWVQKCTNIFAPKFKVGEFIVTGVRPRFRILSSRWLKLCWMTWSEPTCSLFCLPSLPSFIKIFPNRRVLLIYWLRAFKDIFCDHFIILNNTFWCRKLYRFKPNVNINVCKMDIK